MCTLLLAYPARRKCSRWPLVLVAFSPMLWSEKLKVQAWAPSRQPVKDVQIYKHVGSRDTFSWRVNMLCSVYTTVLQWEPDIVWYLIGWGIIRTCVVQVATLLHFDTYLNVLSSCNLYLGRKGTLHVERKKCPLKCALNTWIIRMYRFSVFSKCVWFAFLWKSLITSSHWWRRRLKNFKSAEGFFV